MSVGFLAQNIKLYYRCTQSKNTFKKVVNGQKDLFWALLDLRNTSTLGKKYTPNDIMFNKNVRGFLSKMNTPSVDYEEVRRD